MNSSQSQSSAPDMKLFWCCFIALITTSFGFIVRVFSIGDWAGQFGLSATQQSEIFGVGLWPFAISIVLFSLVIDKIGYKAAMVFAFICHVLSVILTLRATGYWSLYWATLVAALAAGTVEAVINPVVATMFNKDKGKWLNILHAGWPGGLALAGLIAILMKHFGVVDWHTRVFLILIPAAIYGIMMIPRKFPVNERVAAGVTYKEMLKQVGALGCFIVTAMILGEVTRVYNTELSAYMSLPQISFGVMWAIIILISVAFGLYVRSLGRPLFVILLLIMLPLATTELGTDSWIAPLMEASMSKLGLNAGWLLVYTSAIMTVLRFFAGPLIHKFTPLGLLAICSLLAAVGLSWLSRAETGVVILLAATLYGIAKSFFWPTMLSVVSERFPQGGALTLNAAGGVGMLGVGVVGLALLGMNQDSSIKKDLINHDLQNGTVLESTYVTKENRSIFGAYTALDQQKVAASATEEEKAVIGAVVESSKKGTLQKIPVLPVVMLLSYLLLLLYFRSQGGYRPVHLGAGGH